MLTEIAFRQEAAPLETDYLAFTFQSDNSDADHILVLRCETERKTHTLQLTPDQIQILVDFLIAV